MKGGEIIQKTKVPLLWLVVTSNSRSAWFHSVQWSDATLEPHVAVISGAFSTRATSVKGRESSQKNKVPLLGLVVMSNLRPAWLYRVYWSDATIDLLVAVI